MCFGQKETQQSTWPARPPPPLCTTAFPPSDQALSFASGLAFAHLRPSLPFSRSVPSPLLFRLPFSPFLCGRFLFSVQFRPDLTGVGHLQQSPLPALSLDCVLALSGLSFSSLSPFSSVPLFSCPLRSSPLLLSSRCSWCGSRGFSFLCHWAGRFMAPQAPRHNGSGSTKPSGHLHPCVAPSWLLPLPHHPISLVLSLRSSWPKHPPDLSRNSALFELAFCASFSQFEPQWLCT